MPRVYRSPTRDAIIEAIRQHGPMTAADVADRIGIKRKSIDSAIFFARHAKPHKLLTIVDHRKHIGSQGRDAPIYGLGDLPDALPPSRDRAATLQRYREKFTDAEWREMMNRRSKAARVNTKRKKTARVDFWVQQLTARNDGQSNAN